MSRPAARHVVVIGDGPAGALVGAACRRIGLDVAVVGEGRPWTATYATWVDDIEGDRSPFPDPLPTDLFAGRCDRVVASGVRHHDIERAYGVLDHGSMRRHLGLDDLLVTGRAVRWREVGRAAEVELSGGSTLRAAFVVDATGAGRGRRPVAWQTAFGVVVDPSDLPSHVPTDAVTLMRWNRPGVDPGVTEPSFLYAVPVGERWLVEQTVLAASPAVDPGALRAGLAEHVGAETVAAAEADGLVEQVRIPMGLPPVRPAGRIVPFGAAAGLIHPATGYSVAASARAAVGLADAIAGGDPSAVAGALWPSAQRRARRLHDYGLRALLELGPVATAEFFDAFFSLPVDEWRRYLRVDTTPAEVSQVMRHVFAASPWRVRARLAGTGPAVVARRLLGR